MLDSGWPGECKRLEQQYRALQFCQSPETWMQGIPVASLVQELPFDVGCCWGVWQSGSRGGDALCQRRCRCFVEDLLCPSKYISKILRRILAAEWIKGC